MARRLGWWGLGSLLIVASGAIVVRAQTTTAVQTLFAISGMRPGDGLGTVVGGAGDANSDGLGDVLVGSEDSLHVLKGARGGSLYDIDADRLGDFLRARAFPVEDLDGDGPQEIVVAAPFADAEGLTDAGALYLYSGGATLLPGATSRQSLAIYGSMARGYFGASVALIGDVDGDRLPEVAVGAPLETGRNVPETGSVYIVTLPKGQIRQIIRGLVPGGRFGTAVAGMGDVTGDGKPDLAVGAPLAEAGGKPRAGAVYLVSGANWSILGDGVTGSGPEAQLGTSLANAGDIDGDRQADLIMGEPGAAVGGLPGAGRVIVYSFNGGRTLFSLQGASAEEGFGTVVAGGFDVDGGIDNHPDFLVGSPGADVDGQRHAGRVQIFSGADAHPLYTLSGNAGELLGFAGAFVPDVSGDRRQDVIIGAPRHGPPDTPNIGRAIAIRLGGP